jgi:type VI secretion system protein ImpG
MPFPTIREGPMDKLLPYYEQELGILRRACQAFAQRHPALAAELGLTADSSADADVERLLQSVALLNASLGHRLDTAHQQLTGPLLNNIQPHAIHPLPAFGVVQIEGGATQLTRISRGAEFDADNGCRYCSTSDVAIAPIEITALRYLGSADLPAALRIPSHAAASIELAIRSSVPGEQLSRPLPFRVYLDAAPPMRAALLDAIFLDAIAVCAEVEGQWELMDSMPFAIPPVDEDSCLIPGHESPGRLLAEYFHYPDRFAFLDIGLAALLRRHPGCHDIRIVIALPYQRNSREARLLAGLDRSHFKQGCSPVVNLYSTEAASIRLVEGRSEYRLQPSDGKHASAVPYRIESVLLREHQGEEDRRIEPYDGINHHSGPIYWRLHGETVRLVGECGEQVDAGAGALTVRYTATNGPEAARPERLTMKGSTAMSIRMLSYCPQCGPADEHWSLFEPRRIDTVESLRGLLQRQGGAGNAVANAVQDLHHDDASAWCSFGKESRYLYGTESRIVVDERLLSGHSLYLFAQLMSRCFRCLTREGSYSLVILVSAASGKEILSCAPQPGTIPYI